MQHVPCVVQVCHGTTSPKEDVLLILYDCKRDGFLFLYDCKDWFFLPFLSVFTQRSFKKEHVIRFSLNVYFSIKEYDCKQNCFFSFCTQINLDGLFTIRLARSLSSEPSWTKRYGSSFLQKQITGVPGWVWTHKPNTLTTILYGSTKSRLRSIQRVTLTGKGSYGERSKSSAWLAEVWNACTSSCYIWLYLIFKIQQQQIFI